MDTKRICGCDMTAADEVRFWKKVDKDTADPCWIWTAAPNPDTNYGQFRIRTRIEAKMLYAHRVSYELAKGPIADGLVVRHGPCASGNKGKRLCVNPEHLTVGTRKQNYDDMRLGWWRPEVPFEEVPLTADERANMALWEAEAEAIINELRATTEPEDGEDRCGTTAGSAEKDSLTPESGSGWTGTGRGAE
jgi:hypothetical protein